MPEDERNYYVLCDDNCRFPAMTAEQVIEAIAEATGNVPEHVDDAFITKIKESNHEANLTFWKGTEAEFNALGVTAPVYKVGVDSNGKLYFTPMTASDIASHATSHATGGSDPITPANIGAASTTHASTHATGGSDEITPTSIGALGVGAVTGSVSHQANLETAYASMSNGQTMFITSNRSGNFCNYLISKTSELYGYALRFSYDTTNSCIELIQLFNGVWQTPIKISDLRRMLEIDPLEPADIGAATAAQGTKADNAMPKSGGTFTGNVTLKKTLFTSASYGTTLPSSGVAGQIFFKKV